LITKSKTLGRKQQTDQISDTISSISDIKTNLSPLDQGCFGYQSDLKQKNEEFFIFRPFLKITRHTLFLFSKQLKLPVHYDKSNKDLNISRNYIRKVILPLLKKMNPRVEEKLYKFSRIIEFYYEFVGDLKCPPTRFDTFNP
jgi:tRNA(Ile)-lysidine synthase TilS/MesJ